jgi:hypothetical protein
VAGSVAAASVPAGWAEALSAHPLSQAAESARLQSGALGWPLLVAAEFAVDPWRLMHTHLDRVLHSQVVVSEAETAVSVTAADLRWARLAPGYTDPTATTTTIIIRTTPTTIPTRKKAAATSCSGAYIPGMAGVSSLSRFAAEPAAFGVRKGDRARSNKVEDRAGRNDSGGLGVFCPKAVFSMLSAGTPLASHHGC